MNQMLAQINSQPELFKEIFEKCDDFIRSTIKRELAVSIRKIYITGCGDSYFAALGSQLAFHKITGIPTQPITSLQFARYEAGISVAADLKTNLVIGISVSGTVSRTIEALRMGNKDGALTIAITTVENSPITREAMFTILAKTPDFPDPPGTHTPGIRSYLANQLTLLLIAVCLGELQGKLSSSEADTIRKDIRNLDKLIDQTITISCKKAEELINDWHDAHEFVFVGGGPNYGTALFSAAKILEASGDSAIGQETEEWCHLQYFARMENTPTVFITAADRDLSRITEAIVAAHTIGRRTGVIAPRGSLHTLGNNVDHFLPVASVPEVFSPMILSIPCELLAAFRAELIGEQYFRGFSGGRNIEDGGGISRIRTSEIWKEWQEL